jgi:hypothetical protein
VVGFTLHVEAHPSAMCMCQPQVGGARELGEEGLEEFLETKHVHWDFSQERKAWWFQR